MELHELIRMTTLINRLAKRALFAEEQMVALEGQCAEWKRIADELKAERDAAKQEAVSARQDAVTRAEADRKRIDGLMIQAQDMRAEIERLKKPGQHPVKVGESVRRTTEGSIAPIGTLGRVLVVWSDAYQVELRKGFSTMWAFDDCTPCDPPTASHDTPAGKAYAQDCAVQVRPPDPAKVPVMHGLVSTDGKSVRMAVADVPPDGVMQRDTRHCEGAAVGGTRATVQRPSFDIVKLTKLPGSNPAAISAEADYALASLPRTEWASLKDRWPELR